MLSSDEGSNGYGNYKTCSKRNLEAIGGFGGNLPLFSLVDLLGFATRVAYLKECIVRKTMKLKLAGIALNRRQDGTQTNVI